MDSRSTFFRSMFVAAGLFCAIFAAEFAMEYIRLGQPSLADMSWADANNAKIVDILSPMARAYNNILAMLIATIGLAIPLTANMHTPKLIDMFLRDRTNRFMLFACAFGAANVLFADWLVGPNFATMWTFRISVIGAILGWVALVPYFFYVVRFLDPSNILSRLKDQTCEALADVHSGKLAPNKGQVIVHERLNQIGTIILKSIDRADRSVVTEGVWTLKQILDVYGEAKAKMPHDWFRVDRQDFVGMSSEALELLNEDGTWFEMKVMGQMYLAYQQALSKSTDAVSWISDATRVIGTLAHQRGDRRAAGLIVKFFNNYLREAIKRKDMHALYDLYYQYRCLGRDTTSDAELVRKIGGFLRIYSLAAGNAGLTFAAHMAAFDLGWLVRRAYDNGCDAAADLLAEMLRFDHMAGGKPQPMLIEAKVILGAGLAESGRSAEAELVRANLSNVPGSVLGDVAKTLLENTERSFYEVTDRQVNFEFVPPARRPHVKALVEQLAAARAEVDNA
ncbi:MAG: DUF2254 domain-containing protein [Deltaproteobacteria bacterium]|nr:DUF2254 domain-containing protein [Deltaproteobacteria bacterium]